MTCRYSYINGINGFTSLARIIFTTPTSQKMSSKPIDEEDEFEEFEQEDWDLQRQVSEHINEWTANWEDAEWDDEDPDDSFQNKLREEIKKALERNAQAKGK
jgi:hypothetical protein